MLFQRFSRIFKDVKQKLNLHQRMKIIRFVTVATVLNIYLFSPLSDFFLNENYKSLSGLLFFVLILPIGLLGLSLPILIIANTISLFFFSERLHLPLRMEILVSFLILVGSFLTYCSGYDGDALELRDCVHKERIQK